MKMKVLGCDGGSLPGFFPISLQINEELVVDAGSLTTTLSLKNQHKLKHILLTHSHLDHIKDLCFLVDNLFLSGRTMSLNVYSSNAILEDLRKHIFNGIIWPKMTQIPSPAKPMLSLKSIKGELTLNKLKIKAIPVHHSHSALGFIISDVQGSIVISGDTAPTEELWEAANRTKNLKAIFIETSFPNGLSDIALKSKHLTPATLSHELRKIKNQTVPFYIYALKPLFIKQIHKEIRSLNNSRLRILKNNQVLHF